MNLDTLWHSDPVPFAPDAELATILAARAGDESARLAILSAYLPALRAAASRVVTATRNGVGQPIAVDDIRQATVLGLFEAVAAFDATKHTTLAGLVKQYITNALSALSGATFGHAIPPRTRNRYAQVMRAAEGDPELAAELAPSFDLRTDTFWEIYASASALYGHIVASGDDTGDSEDFYSHHHAAASINHGQTVLASVEDRIVAQVALSANLTARERAVVTLLYGLEGAEPLSAIDAAAQLNISRPTVNRDHASALTKMRGATLAS